MPVLSIFLFFRQIKIDREKYWEEYDRIDNVGDLHMLKEIKKFYEENGLDSSKFDVEIKILEEDLRKL